MKISKLALLWLCAALGWMEPAMAAKVLGVRSYRAPDYTRLVFDLDAPLQSPLETKTEANRLLITLKHSTLVGQLDKLTPTNTPITGIKNLGDNDHDLHVALTLRSKVDPRSFTLSKNEQYSDRLVIDLYDVVTKNGPSAETDYIDIDAISAITASLDKGGKRDIVVAVSAGHGGDDPGAIGVKGLQEKQVTLAISREVAALIDKQSGYKAVLVRDGDYYIGLRQHMKIAHDNHADLFLEIHADAADNKSARGATVYALSDRGATSEQARRLADKENSADLMGGVDLVNLENKNPVLASVLLDLSMTGSVKDSLEIGSKLIASLDSVTRLRRRNVEQAAFVVLKSADIPSLLVESGYITNPADAADLDSPVWRKQFAASLVTGITRWFDERPPRGTLIAWQKDHDKPAFKEHKIARGETLSVIASIYSVSLDAIRTTNQLKSDNIRPGQVLKIPAS